LSGFLKEIGGTTQNDAELQHIDFTNGYAALPELFQGIPARIIMPLQLLVRYYGATATRLALGGGGHYQDGRHVGFCDATFQDEIAIFTRGFR
jgi:hypothetical protein